MVFTDHSMVWFWHWGWTLSMAKAQYQLHLSPSQPPQRMVQFLLNSNLQIWNYRAQLAPKCIFQFLSTPMTRRGQANFPLTFERVFLIYSWQTFPRFLGNNSMAFSDFLWKIKNQQFCYNLYFKKEVRNNYLKTIPHTQHAASLPDVNWVLGKNSLLANHLRNKIFWYWFWSSMNDRCHYGNIGIWKWRYKRWLLPWATVRCQNALSALGCCQHRLSRAMLPMYTTWLLNSLDLPFFT